MRFRITAAPLLFILLPVAAFGSSILSYRATSGSDLRLCRAADRIVLKDVRTEEVVASGRASSITRVVVRGADGNEDDTLEVDLTGLDLPGGIDYDGGIGGFDTLVVSGVARHATATPSSPHDGVLDYDGLRIRYSNIEPISDTAAGASLVINGTAGDDTITVTGSAADWTVASPTFESVTFANKTSVTIDGLGGNDTIQFAVSTPPTGLTTLLVNNMEGVSGTVGVSSLGISSTTGAISLNTTVDNIEAQTPDGAILIINTGALRIGGVSPSLRGIFVTNNGDVTVQTGGTLTLRDTDGPAMVEAGTTAGNVSLNASNPGSDVDAVANNVAILAPAGLIQVTASQDILFGTAGDDFNNDVRANLGVTFTAGRDIGISGAASVAADAFGNNTNANVLATAAGNISVSNLTGTTASIAANGSGNVTLQTGLDGSLTLSSPLPGAVSSFGGNIFLTADHLIVQSGSGATANNGTIQIQALTLSRGVNLGSTTDLDANRIEISDAEVDAMTTPRLLIADTDIGGILISAPITRATGELELRSNAVFFPSPGGSLSAPTLTLNNDLSSLGVPWTVTPTTVEVEGAGPIPYSGVTTLNVVGSSGNDSFQVTPSATTTINVNGFFPDPPAAPGDTLNVDPTGTTSPGLAFTSTPTGLQGSYTFGNRAAVNFQRIETLAPTVIDVAITKSDGVTSATPGGTVTYTIAITDQAGVGANGATVTDNFPAGFTSVSWSCLPSVGAVCTATGAGNINDTVTIPPGGSITYNVLATISSSATGSITNTATVTPAAGATDTNLVNNSASDTDTLASSGDLSVTKTDSPDPVSAGSDLTYIITVSAIGPSDSQNVAVSDALPANTTFVSATQLTGPAFAVTTSPTSFGATIASMAAGSTATFRLVVHVNITTAVGTVISNTATVTSSTSDPTPANNSSTSSTTVSANIPALSSWTLLLLALACACVGAVVLKTK
jgi:uncharacterized repeat protein (TIGR01451 family)